MGVCVWGGGGSLPGKFTLLNDSFALCYSALS